MVRVVEQVGVQEAGEKDAMAFCGRPETEKETACAVPESRVAGMVVATAAPWVPAWLPPLLREKSKGGGAGAVTVKVKLVVWVTPPPLPVTVIVEGPVGVDVVVERVRVVVQVGTHAVAENEAVAPRGSPEV